MIRKLAGCALLLLAAALIASCGGGGGGGSDANGSAGEQPIALMATASHGPAVVVSLTKISETSVSGSVFDYVFKITVQNGSQAQTALTATLTRVGQGTTVIAGSVLVGDLASGARVSPPDTITLRHDRAFTFDPAAMIWRLRGIPTVAAIVPGAALFNYPAGRATVGTPYEANIRFASRDPRNPITSFQVSNATPGGAVAALSLAGRLSWAPNEADFSTTSLQIAARLQDGSVATFDVPVTVTRYRLVAQLAINGAGRYSDLQGRYLIEVTGASAGSSVSGTLTIAERYDMSGAFTHLISSSDDTHVIQVILAPVGLASATINATASRAGRARPL